LVDEVDKLLVMRSAAMTPEACVRNRSQRLGGRRLEGGNEAFWVLLERRESDSDGVGVVTTRGGAGSGSANMTWKL